jgi:aryl-alcohol dehydrogenase
MRIIAAVSREGAAAPVLEELELEAPRAGEVLVRIATAGICHTDLRAHMGGVLPTPRPVVLGHEGAGTIMQVGAGVKGLAPGDRVVLSGSSCGVCAQCRDQLPGYCVEGMPRSFGGARGDGTTALTRGEEKVHSHFFGQSSFATHAVADASGVVPLDDDIPFAVASPLGCGVITGAGAILNAFGLRAGQTLAVFGAGGVGLSAVMAARLAGARKIIVIEPVESRRALALDLGATQALDPAVDDVEARVRGAVGRGVDFALNTTTVAAVLATAQRVLGARGVLGFVSATREPFTAPLFPMLVGGQSLRGIVGGDSLPARTIPQLLEFWRQGRFPLERLITRFAFADIATAFAACRAGTAIKPVLEVNS